MQANSSDENLIDELSLDQKVKELEVTKRAMFSIMEDLTDSKSAIEKNIAEIEATLQSIGDALVVTDNNGKITKINNSFEELTGWKQEEALGKDLIEVLPREDDSGKIVPREERLISTILREETIDIAKRKHPFVCTYIRKDNVKFLASVVLTPIYSEDKLIGAVEVFRDITEEKKKEEDIKKSELFFKESQKAASIGSYYFYYDRDRWDSSDILNQIFGIDDNFNKTLNGWISIVHPDDREMMARYFKEDVILNGKQFDKEYRIIRKSDGETRWVHGLGKTDFNQGKVTFMVGTIQDITDKKKDETVLIDLNRERQAVIKCSHIVLRSTDEEKILTNICHVICDDIGYQMAWVGYVEHDLAKTVKPMAWAGNEDGYLSNVNITWADEERGHGPTGTAIRTGEAVYIQDLEASELFRPWLQNALERGYHSSIAMPLKDDSNNVFAVLNIYSNKTNAFTFDEMRLIRELTEDISFGIRSIRVRNEAKRLEEQLSQNEQRFRRIFEEGPLGMVTLGKDLHFSSANSEFCKMVGYSEDELKSLTFVDITHPDTVDKDKEKVEQLIKGEINKYKTEKRYIKKDGSFVWVLITVTVIRNDIGKFLYFLTMVEDISERKIANDALENSEYQLNEIIDFLPDPVLVIDSGKRVVVWNKAIERMTGVQAKDILGKGDYEYTIPFYGEKRPSLMDLLWQEDEVTVKKYTGLKRENNTISAEAFCNALYGGKGAHIFAKASPFYDKDGKVMGTIELIRDITHEKELDISKNEFISLTSHQLRTPLSAMKWTLELFMEDEGLEEKQKERLHDIYSSNERLINLVNNILNVANIDAGKLIVNKRSVNLLDCLNISCELCKVNASRKRQKINISTPNDTKEVNIDPVFFNRAFENILSNATTYAPEDSDIDVIVTQKDNDYLIAIHNTGLPILDTDHEKYFTKFYRGTAPESTIGNGLGLYIAKSSVLVNGGKIWFESDVDKGTTFYFTVPIK